MPDKLIITVSDARRFGYCVGGIRSYLMANGINFLLFVKDGIDSDVLEASGAFGKRLVEHVRERK
jgi:hypothetical protein